MRPMAISSVGTYNSHLMRYRMPNKIVTINISDFVGPVCIDRESGNKLFSKIKQLIDEGRHVRLSFAGTSEVIPTFLNSAIGQLYGCFARGVIQDRLSVDGLENEDLQTLKQVVDNAVRYYHLFS